MHVITSPPQTAWRLRRCSLPALVCLCGMLATGCATQQNPDPLESLNRKTFALNEGLDKAVLKPVAQAYRSVVPTPVRSGVSNFLSNLTDRGPG